MKIAYLSEENLECLIKGLEACRKPNSGYNLDKVSEWVDAVHLSGAFKSELETKEELWIQVYWQVSNELGQAKFFRDVQAFHCGEIIREKEAHEAAKVILQEMKNSTQALEQNLNELDERFPKFNDLFE